jgi:dipeptidyl aminopeptidase/acylaminoacyl peptidase
MVYTPRLLETRTMPRTLFLVLLGLAMLFVACPKEASRTAAVEVAEPTPEPEPPKESVVDFRGRSIDIEPHIAGFPYRGFKPIPELGALLYMHEGKERSLRMLPLDGDLDLAAGKKLHDIDWNSRSNFGGYEPLPEHNAIIIKTDEDNHEDYDLYTLSLNDGSLTKLTDVPYIYGFALDAERERLYYVARYPIEGKETYTSCLEWIPPTGGTKTEIVCDDAKMNFVWTTLAFSPDGRWVYLSANADNDRARSNLLRVDTISRAPVPERMTKEASRNWAGVMQDRLDDGSWLFVSDESGFANLYRGTDEGGVQEAFTSYVDEDLQTASILQAGGMTWVVITLRRPFETEIVVLDSAGAPVDSLPIESNLYHLGESDTEVWYYETSRYSKMETFRLSLNDDGTLVKTDWIGLPDDLQAKLDHCEVEQVSISTWDIDPATGERRKLHAYYSTPRVAPTDDASKLAGIVAFYGGGNYWDTTAEIYCQAGIATLSASVRGSWGFGKEFASLNDKDLGGNEIVDLHWLAKWLRVRGYKARNIGVFGGSHGGYATMRAMTFPAGTNDHESSFQWGWGVSLYGFSDIKTFWEKCNIPDWVLLEAGDPETEPEKIRDRSPLHHVDLLDAPILLLHGENDLRVPVDESRQFKAACDEAGKECRYIEFEGQGHGLKGLINQTRVWKETFGYLDRVIEVNAAR